MATKTDTPNSVEEQDSAHNVAQDLSDREFNSIVNNFDETADDSTENKNIEKAKNSHTDDYGDEVQNNPNADVKEREEDGDSLYKTYNPSSQGATGKVYGGMRGWMKKAGPTGGVVGMLLFGIVAMGGGSIGLASSLLINIKEIFHNDRSDPSRSNRLHSRAFLAGKFDNNVDCTGSKIKCKMIGMSRSQMKKFKEMGFKIKGYFIKADGTKTGQNIEDDRSLDPGSSSTAPSNANAPPVDETERGVMTEIETPEGDTAKSGKELYELTDKKQKIGTLRALERAMPSKAAFYLNKFFDKVMAKFHNFSKGKKAFPEDNKDGAQDDAFNNQTAPDESERAQTVRQTQEAEGEENNPNNQSETSGQNSNNSQTGGGAGSEPNLDEANGVLDEAGKSAVPKKVRGGAALIAQGICAIYKTSRAVNTAVALQQAAKLGAFALLFFQSADEIKNGIASGPKTTYLSNNLTYYESNEKMEKDDPDLNLSQGDPNPKYNKSATDSDGYKIAATGNTAALQNYSKKYMLGAAGAGIAITAVTKKITDTIQDVASLGGTNLQGRKNVKEFCRAVNNPKLQLVQAAVGCGSSVTNPLGAVTCVSAACSIPVPAIQSGCGALIQKAVEKAIDLAKNNKSLTSALAKALRKIDVSSSTKGVDAGNAIAAGSGAVLSVTGSGYGMKPAAKTADGNNPEISNYIAYTQPLENTYIALAKDDAKKTPLDMTNQYSMLGTLVRSFDLYSATPTSLMGNVSTLASAFPSAFNSFFTGQSVSALYNQPSTAADGASGRYKNCDAQANEDLDYIGAVGDSFCSIVNVTSVAELKDTQKAIDNPKGDTSISNLVDYMTQQGAGASSQNDTKDMSSNCTNTDGTDDPGCGKSLLPSIDEDGKPTTDSQYHKFITYCTDERKNPWGAQSEPYEQGTERDQRWYSGEECMKGSGDTNDRDTPEDRMLKNFRQWTNYCLQAGTWDGTSNCHEDDADTEESAEPVGNIAEVAKQMGAWGAQYNSCYTYGGGHSRDKAWIQDAIKNHFSGAYAVDCSAFVRAVILQATNKDIGDQNTNSMCADTRNFQQIPRSQAKPGDLAIDCSSHVEVITEVNGGNFKTVGSHTTGCGPGFGSSPGNYQGGSFVLRYKG